MTSQHVKNKSSGVTVVLYMHASYAETPPMFFRVGFQICTNLMKYWWGGGGGGGGDSEKFVSGLCCITCASTELCSEIRTEIELVSPIESYCQSFYETIKLQITVSHILKKYTRLYLKSFMFWFLSTRFEPKYFLKMNISVNISDLRPCSHC